MHNDLTPWILDLMLLWYFLAGRELFYQRNQDYMDIFTNHR